MRQDARHRSLPLRHPRARAAATHAAEQLSFAFRDDPRATLGRIGPLALPTPSVDWHARGVELELAGDLAAAIDCYANALRTRPPSAQLVFDLAHALADSGERSRAAERYRQVIELDATRADAWNNLGDLLAADDQTAAAIDAFAHAIALAPADAAAYYNLADTLDALGRHDESRAMFEAFLDRADPDGTHVDYARSRLTAH